MSYLFDRLLTKARRAVSEMRWPALILVGLAHLASSWAALAAAGEAPLTPPLTFLYFYATTATTVGYGDLSPQTETGRLIAILWLFPGAIALFTAFLSKTITSLAAAWRRRMAGQADFSNRRGLTVLVGFNRVRTAKMIEELRRGARGREDDEILVVAKRDAQPLPDGVLFVRVDQLSDGDGLRRAGVKGADEVLIIADDDDETLAATLAVQALAPQACHIVAYFQDEQTATLVRSLERPIETVVSPSVELLVRAAQDPGASRLFAALASSRDQTATIFSLVLREAHGLDTIQDRLEQVGGLLMAIQPKGSTGFTLPHKRGRADAGDRIFYVAEKRLSL